MSDVKRLLDGAELPWGIEPPSKERATLAHIIRAHETGPQVANVLLPDDADLIVYAVNRLPDYEAAVDALERLYLNIGGNRDGDHTACTVEKCWWRQAKDALVALNRTVDTSRVPE